MSYIDYRVELAVDCGGFIAGKDDTMHVVVVIREGSEVVKTVHIPVAPVLGEESLKMAVGSAMAVALSKSWKNKPFTTYHEGEYVRVVSRDGSHGFPVGSIIKLIAIDEEDCLDDAPDVTWIASGYTTSLHDVSERYIGEDAFVKVGSEEE